MASTTTAPEYRNLVGEDYDWAATQISLEGHTVGRVDYHRGRPNTYHNRSAAVYVYVGKDNLVKSVRFNNIGPAAWGRFHAGTFR